MMSKIEESIHCHLYHELYLMRRDDIEMRYFDVYRYFAKALTAMKCSTEMLHAMTMKTYGLMMHGLSR